ncbi:RHS repeat-associated core domain-containing protein [Streptomyces sp. NPDC041068]|uniref:RHS repeat-associated core domain-containing protein n=1 Tax=Streptomyces sp. NPDC041068 TaxID=3155130 RepID=UPI003409FEFA
MGGHRPSDWHVLDLEKDPTPGDPQRVRKLAKDLHDFADDVGKVLRDIKGMAGEDAILQWAGQTAEAFTEKFEDAPSKLKKLKKSYDMAGDALAAYWPELERAQTLADKALVKGREAQADLSSAKSRLSSADSWVDKAGKEADKYKDDGSKGKDVPPPDPDKVKAATRNAASAEKAQKSAQGDVDSAKSALDAAKKMAEDARKMREEAAGTAKRKIDEASDAGIQNRKWWEEIGDWVSDNWDTIVAVCKVVVAVVGVIAMIVGGPILAAIVIVAGAIVLADTLSKYAKGQATLMDVAFAAMDCVPGMKGITTAAKLAKGVKGLKAGVKGLGKNADDALKSGAKGADNRAADAVTSRGSDPIDMATGFMFLPQTDITLPGTLPLAFHRRVSSGYRTGWWFGPTWASTIDQHLEVHSGGVVHVTEDGLLLAYPHPVEPGTPVLPEAGARQPLTRLDNGGYRIDDPYTGHTRFFAAPVDGVALIQRITDRNHNRIDFDHDEEGTPLAIRHSGGYHLKLTVDEGHITSLVLAGGSADGSDLTVRTYEYTDGNLTTVVNSTGHPLVFTYDERLRVTSWTDSNGSRYDYAYDALDRCVAEGGEAGHIAITLDYDGRSADWPGARVTTLTTAEGAVTRFVVNDNSQVVAEIDPLGGTVRTTWDEHHRPLSRTDELGRTTRYERNGLGHPTLVTRPDGSTVQYAYDDALALPTAARLPDGTSWHRAYDARGNCTAVTDTDGATYRYGYSAQGHITSITDPLDHTTTVECDPAGLPLSSRDPLGGTTRWARTATGLPHRFTDPLGRTTRFTWSTEGLLTSRAAADGAAEIWEYDGEGNCVSHTDATGAVSRFEYTHFDMMSARTDPDGARYTFRHDPSLRLTSVTNPQGLTWQYTYDAAGRPVSETDFDGRSVHYTHDAAGHLVARTNALGGRVEYAHDSLGRVVRSDAEGAVTEYAYDPAGRLVRATTADSTLTLRRDAAGRLVSQSTDGRELTHVYDALGRVVSRTTPSGATTTWSYDAAGNRNGASASGHALRFEYDAAGQEVARHIGAELTLTHSFDEQGRLTAQSVTAGGTRRVQHRAYRYGGDGSLLGVDDQLSGSRSFGLDAAKRVTAVHADGWSERYAYDQAGNQTEAAWPSTHPGQDAVGTRAYEGTRLTHAGRVRYEYDALGRVVLRQRTRLSRKPETWRYEWDVQDKLRSVVTPDGTRWTYRYDPLGRRSAKQRLADDGRTVVEQVDFTWEGTTLCEQTTRARDLPHEVTLTWDHDGLRPLTQLERITTPAGGKASSEGLGATGAVGLLDAPSALQQEIDSRFFAIVTDLIGTPTELVDERGDIAWRTRSTLWGTTAWESGSTAYTPLRFPGQYFDPETGLHHNYFRHYEPETGRYATPDPLGLAPAPNPVSYVANPHTWSDPLGLSPYPYGQGFPDRKLPRDKHGNPAPDPAAEGYPHTQLGIKPGRRDRYAQAREFDADGQPVRDIDFTDHGRPQNHDNPHQHRYLPNPTGGTRQRGPAEPLEWP